MYIIRLFLLAEDDGGNGGAGGAEDLGGRISHVAASYENDLDEALRNDDFTGIEDVGKLYGAYKEAKAQNAKDKEALDNSLRIPGKDSSYDDVKAFFQKIGMPEKAEDYGLSDYDLDPAEIADMKRNFMDSAHRSGLTKVQANNLWKHEAATYAAFKRSAQAQVEELTKNLDQRYDAVLKDEYPDDTRRAERMTLERNLFTEVVGKANLGEYLSKTGLNLNPNFMHALATFYEKYAHSDPASQGAGRAETEAERLKRKYPSMFKGE